MGLQIFPEPFYTRRLCPGEHIGITADNKRFVVLPPESFSNRVKRFFTFQQDPYIDRVHNRIKNLLEQFEQAQGSDFPILRAEIHDHGHLKYQYLEANLYYLREKLNEVGQLNCFSALILAIRNAVANFFGMDPIQVKTYARHYHRNDDGYLTPCIDPSFNIRRTYSDFDFEGLLESPLNPLNPFQKEGLRLTEEDVNTCRFSAEFSHRRIIQKLEKGLVGCLLIDQATAPSGHISANLGIGFNLERQCFFAAINSSKRQISSSFAGYLQELPQEERTFRFFIRATDPHGNVTDHELAWTAEPTREEPFMLNTGSQPLFLEPGVQYVFFDKQRQVIPCAPLKIVQNH